MSSFRRLSRGLLAAVALAAVSCGGDDPRDLRWQLELGAGVGEERVRGYEATIREGTCEAPGDERYRSQARVGSPFPDEPKILEPGTYAFGARALDVDCQWIASGCEEQALPAGKGTIVHVVLDPLPMEESACPGSQRCDDGLCNEPDAGSELDATAGLDAAAGTDAAVGRDAGLDAGVDAAVGLDAGVDAGGCAPGWDDCNGLPGDGCERHLNTLSNCGACFQQCSLPHASETCESFTCEIDECENTWEDCDGNPANGCEACAGNCGAGPCNFAGASESCVGGVCTFGGCDSRHADCAGGLSDGCETYIWEDERNCGDCGVVCQGGQECQKGSCQ